MTSAGSALPSSVQETSLSWFSGIQVPGNYAEIEVTLIKSFQLSLHGSPGSYFPYISTVHVGAFVLIASEIILAPDSPMGFPWRLEQKS